MKILLPCRTQTTFMNIHLQFVKIGKNMSMAVHGAKSIRDCLKSIHDCQDSLEHCSYLMEVGGVTKGTILQQMIVVILYKNKSYPSWYFRAPCVLLQYTLLENSSVFRRCSGQHKVLLR